MNENEIKERAEKIVQKILKTSVPEGQLPDDETIKVLRRKAIEKMKKTH